MSVPEEFSDAVIVAHFDDVLGDYMHFRCHIDELDVKQLVEFLTAQTNLICCVKEIGSRPHVHATFKLKCPRTTFTDRLKKKFKCIVGNGYYSCKKVKTTLDRNYRYIYKGVVNDYPDILYTLHTEEEWKDFYRRYWQQQDKILYSKKSSAALAAQTSPIGDYSGACPPAKPRQRVKTFMEKFAEVVEVEHEPLIHSIWSFYGYGDADKRINTLEWCQDYLGNLLLKRLGKSVKNIDDFIFERLFRAIYIHILDMCPHDLTTPVAQSMMENFRHKLPQPKLFS